MSKPWIRPQLLILIRGRAEEAVLRPCKGDGATSAPDSSYGACFSGESNCNAIASS